MKRHLLIDANNLFIIHLSANPSVNSNSEPIGGIVGFLKAITKIRSLLSPTHITCVWDGPGGSTRRRAIMKEYKEGRRPLVGGRRIEFSSPETAVENFKWQKSVLMRCLDHLGICQITSKGCEADDIIAYLAKHADYFEMDSSIIVTCDKDYWQLLDEKIVIYNPMTKLIVSADDILKQTGISAKDWPVYKAVCGDNSDNIKGIKGLGMKTFAKLFTHSTTDLTLDAVLDICSNIEDDKSSKGKWFVKIKENFDLIRQNYKLVYLDHSMMSLGEKDRITNYIKAFKSVVNPLEFFKYTQEHSFSVPADVIFAAKRGQ